MNTVQINNPPRYRIYGKHQTQKHFRPMDLNEGQRVVNLVFASILTEEQKERFMTREVPLNPEWTFEARIV